jgi:hypothetical protein
VALPDPIHISPNDNRYACSIRPIECKIERTFCHPYLPYQCKCPNNRLPSRRCHKYTLGSFPVTRAGRPNCYLKSSNVSCTNFLGFSFCRLCARCKVTFPSDSQCMISKTQQCHSFSFPPTAGRKYLQNLRENPQLSGIYR